MRIMVSVHVAYLLSCVSPRLITRQPFIQYLAIEGLAQVLWSA